jgi:mycofactocin biosynthetic radical S-adenosylmethionine protein MftC
MTAVLSSRGAMRRSDLFQKNWVFFTPKIDSHKLRRDFSIVYRDSILQKVRAQHLLHDVTLELTYHCNLNCFYCCNDRDKKGTPLSFSQYRTLLEDLATMQTMFLMLTGGEPMIHPHFFEIGRMCRELGFVVRVRTNGYTLFPWNIQRLIDEVDPYVVEVTLHGATAEVHDRQTRVQGSFERLIQNLRHARSAGLRCRMVTTPTAWNQHQIEAMIALGDELDAPLHFQGPVGPRDNGDLEPLSIQPDPETWDRIEALMTEQRAKKWTNAISSPTPESTSSPDSETPATCSVGLCGVDIDPFGNVQACMHLQESAGNLHHQSIQEIWNHSPLFARVRQRAIDEAAKLGDKKPRQFGAPLFCLGVEENCAKSLRIFPRP